MFLHPATIIPTRKTLDSINKAEFGMDQTMNKK